MSPRIPVVGSVGNHSRREVLYTHPSGEVPPPIFVYLVVNPAWPDWVKVGRTEDLAARLSSYNVYSPRRDYKVVFKFEHVLADYVEKAALGELRARADRDGRDYAGEWVECTAEQAVAAVRIAVRMADGDAPLDAMPVVLDGYYDVVAS